MEKGLEEKVFFKAVKDADSLVHMLGMYNQNSTIYNLKMQLYHLLAKIYTLRMHLPFYKGHPIFAGIELTNVCNLKCVMCSLTHSTKKKGFMDFEFYKKVFDQCYNLGIRSVVFHVFGEPIMHPKIREIVAYTKGRGIKIYLSTNVQLLNENLARDLMDAGVDLFRLSIEGSNKEDYEKIRVGGNFETLLNNMKSLKDLRDKYYKNVKLIIGSVHMEDSPEKTKEFYKVFSPLVDEITFSPLNNMGGELEGVKPKGYRRRRLCIIPFERVYITWDGLMTVCCLDSNNKLIIGDLKNNSVKELWYSKKYKHYRRLHKLGLQKKMPMCGKCYTASPYEKHLLKIKVGKLLNVNSNGKLGKSISELDV